MTGYKVFMGDLQLPVSPQTIITKTSGQNKEITLADGTNTNILKMPKLTEISFKAELPAVQYSYAEDLRPVTDYTSQFNEWMMKKKPFQLIILRELPDGSATFDTNATVTLENVDYTDSSDNGFDLTANLSMKKYVGSSTTTVRLTTSRKTTSSGSTDTAAVYQIKAPARLDTKQPPSTYTVKEGETLLEICQRELGEELVWTTVAKNNHISDPYHLKPGTVLKLW